ncbi:MAG: TolC family protein [Leptonema sp. (in: bacteria)]
MKLKTIVLVLIFRTSLGSESVSLYNKYFEQLNSQNTDLLLQKKKIEKVQSLIEKKKNLIVSPFSLNFSVKKGNQIQPLNLSLNQPSIEQIVKEYTIGISKVIDLLNTQSSEKEIYEIQKTIENQYLDLLQKQIKNQFRQSYFLAIFLLYIRDHLEEHIITFKELKKRFQNQYFDKRLGNYTVAALEMGITTLQAEYNEMNSLYLKELEILNTLLNQENQNLKFDHYETILNHIPKSLDISKEELKNQFEDSLFYKIEKSKLLLEEKKYLLEKKQIWNQLEFFLNYGIRNLGRYERFVYDVANPEEEKYWIFGFKIPLAYGSELQYNPLIQKKEIEIQTLKLKKMELELKNQISTNYDVFEKEYHQLKANLEILKKYKPLLEKLEDSLKSRRITYFEYWGEHERYHNLMRISVSFLNNSIEALSSLEYFTGKSFFKETL